MKSRRKFTPEFKAKVAMEALQERESTSLLAKKKVLIAGCNDFVTKPVNATMLSKILIKYLMLKVQLQYCYILLQ